MLPDPKRSPGDPIPVFIDRCWVRVILVATWSAAPPCIHGGLITQLEQREMPAILRDARLDAEQSGVRCFFDIQPMSFFDFARRFGEGVQA